MCENTALNLDIFFLLFLKEVKCFCGLLEALWAYGTVPTAYPISQP